VDRRTFNTAVMSAAALALLPKGAVAQQVKSLKIMAAAGPGGGYDQLARAVQEILLSQKLAGGVQVVNVPGAGGTIALAQVVTGKERDPLLLTIGLGMVGAINVNKSPVTLDQVQPFARLAGEYQPLVVSASSPLRTLDDLVKKYQENPGSVSWGGFAPGSPDHILSGLVVKAFGGDVKKMNYVPVGAGGEMLPLVMGNRVTVATGGLNEFMGQIKTGKLRALGISSPERLPGVDIPTFKEQGVDAALVNWRGFVASSGLGGEDRQALEAAIAKMVQSEPWKKLVQQREWVDLYLPSDQFAAFLKEEQTRISALLKEIGLT
jgi:putative tricarboxylic transport membrane protein